MSNFNKDQHAWVVEGRFSEVEESLIKLVCQDLKIDSTLGHPDVLVYKTDVFSVDDSRSISEWQSRRPILGDRKYCILSAKAYTNSAQNALLKIIEEPKSGTRFCVVVPNKHILLDTIISRVEVLSVSKKQISDELGQKFIKASIKKRLEMISKIIEDEGDLVIFLEDIIKSLNILTEVGKRKAILEAVGFVQRSFFNHGVSRKNLLEFLACEIPTKI
jgi:DNA polymerase III delta prime subunit